MTYEGEKQGAIRFLTPRELREQTPTAPPWAWEPYFARGWVTLVGGKPKAGKSTLVFAVLNAIASGAGSFLGRPVTSGPVVLVTEEGPVTALAKLYDNDSIRVLTREGVWPKPSWPELIAAGLEEAKRRGAVMLVVDTFAFWASLPSDEEKSSGPINAAYEPLYAATASGLCVPLVHHHRKSAGDDGDAFRGSSAIVANCDATLEVERLGEGHPARHRRLVALSRWPNTPMMVVDYDPHTNSWQVIGEGEGRADSGSVSWRSRILTALPNEPPGVTAEELAGALGEDKRKWFPELTALLEDGPVDRIGEGVRGDPKRYWRIPSQDSVQDAGTETDRNGAMALSVFRPSPVGRTEYKSSTTESHPVSGDGNGTESLDVPRCCCEIADEPTADGRCSRCSGLLAREAS